MDAPPNPTAPPRVYIETYGCQMNIADSQTVRAVMRQAGFASADRVEDADVILLNTCAIREHGARRGPRTVRLGVRSSGKSGPPNCSKFVAEQKTRAAAIIQRDAQSIGKAMKLTAVFRKVPEGYIAFVEELPGANTQAATLAEARRNLKEAVGLTLEANRTLAEESLKGKKVLREPLLIPER
jgi:predicted RNase H-like HicB family nuclease